MRVLQINKFLYPVGGAEEMLFQTAALLRRHGHEVIFFGMQDPRNTVKEHAGYQVTNLDFGKRDGWAEAIRGKPVRTVFRMLHSREAAERLNDLLEATQPDVAHLHNIYHQLSPSILEPLNRRGIPTVLTLHDYKLICPNYTLYTHGSVCERCKGHKFYQAALQGCVKGSRILGALCAIEAYAHQSIYATAIDAYIAPSRFMAAKMTQFGIDGEQIQYVPNFIPVDTPDPGHSSEPYILYAGRLEAVKGVSTLLAAIRRSAICRHIEVRIAGDGALRPQLEAECREYGLSNVRFLGSVPREGMQRLLQGATVLVMPSLWYENAPLSLLEAYAHGKPVIAARIGGMPELVQDGETGLLFEPGNADDLRGKLDYLVSRPPLAREMGANARRFVKAHFGPEKHYEELMTVYALAWTRRKRDHGEKVMAKESY